MCSLLATAIGTLPVLQSSSSEDDPFFLIAAGFVGGLVAIYWGWRRYRRYMLVRDTPTEKVRSMAVGRTELEGTVRVDEPPLDAPFTGEDCVFATWSIGEYRDDPNDDDHEWQTIASGEDAIDFHLEDDTGRVLVRTGERDADVDLSNDHERTIHVDGHERPPPPVQEFIHGDREDWNLSELLDNPVDAITDVVSSEGTVGSSSNDRRYIQTILPVDHHVYLFGSAQPRPVDEAADRELGANEDLLEMVPDSGTGLFLVSDRKEEKLTDYYSTMALLAIVGGLAVSAVGLYFLLSWYIMA
ncbi:MAG: GIDE domain-containing protein [Haloarculaceae archaeon]